MTTIHSWMEEDIVKGEKKLNPWIVIARFLENSNDGLLCLAHDLVYTFTVLLKKSAIADFEKKRELDVKNILGGSVLCKDYEVNSFLHLQRGIFDYLLVLSSFDSPAGGSCSIEDVKNMPDLFSQPNVKVALKKKDGWDILPPNISMGDCSWGETPFMQEVQSQAPTQIESPQTSHNIIVVDEREGKSLLYKSLLKDFPMEPNPISPLMSKVLGRKISVYAKPADIYHYMMDTWCPFLKRHDTCKSTDVITDTDLDSGKDELIIDTKGDTESSSDAEMSSYGNGCVHNPREKCFTCFIRTTSSTLPDSICKNGLKTKCYCSESSSCK